LQNNFLSSPSVRKVLNNLRILLTAMFTRMIMGTGYTQMQWCLIVTIVLVTFQFLFLTSAEMNPFVGDKDLILGMIFNLIASLAAVFGSLLGEKHMKANKHLPFYLQNFQFSLPTMCFSILGLVTTNGFAAILGDCVTSWMSGEDFDAKKIFSLNGKNGLGTQLISASRTGFFTYQSAFTSVRGEVKYFDNAGAEKHFLFSNKYNMGGWDTTDDRVATDLGMIIKPVITRFEQDPSVTEHEQLWYQETHMIYTKVAEAATAYAKIALLENNFPLDADLSTYATRSKMLPGVHSDEHLKALKKKDLEGQKKHKAAPFPHVNDGKRLNRHAGDRYRTLPGNLIYDSKFLSSQPFGFASKASPWSDLKNKFGLYIGRHAKINHFNEEGEDKKKPVEMLTFKAFSLFRRDSPHWRHLAMKNKKLEDSELKPKTKGKDGKDLSDKEKEVEKTKAEKENKANEWVWAGKSENYFKLITEIKEENPREVQKGVTEAGEPNMVPVTDLSVAYAEMKKFVTDASEKQQGDLPDRLKNLETKLRRTPPIYRTQTWSQAVKYEHKEIEDTKKTFPFLTVTYTRTITDRINFPSWTGQALDEDSLSLKKVSTFKIPFVCGDRIDYKHAGADIEGHMGKKFQCYLGKEDGKEVSATEIVKESNFKTEVPVMTFTPAVGEPEDFKEPEGLPTAVAPENRFFIGTADQKKYGKDLYFMHGSKMEDLVNELAMYEKKHTDGGGAFFTYPGEVPAGICTYDSCHMSKEKQDNSGVGKLMSRSFHNPNRRTSPFDKVASFSDRKNEEPLHSAIANPFLYGIIHGYTRNPTPPAFFFTVQTLIAASCNIGQSWMSALTSKVLSSLWKTIASGVAFAILPILECLTYDARKQAEIPVFPLMLGVITVFLTVYLFQLAPKPPKKEEGAAKDLEAGKK